jgi:hypothetical protein
MAGLTAAVAGCSQAPPTPAPTTAPPPPTTAPAAPAAASAAPSVAAKPAASPSASAAVAPSPAVKPAASPSASPAAAASPAPNAPLTIQQLSDIQPGLGTVMIEYARRMGTLWFAGQAENWDLAAYQLLEMREIQEVGETTRPARAAALKSFESSFLDPLDEQIKAKDKTQFQTAYNSAIQGCNACHGSQTSADFPQSFSFIKVQTPSTSIWDIYKWDGR